tara:strand:+ start:1789 stop:2049 length:261 start_codon:yes stop_codon:yes gene_type:complete
MAKLKLKKASLGKINDGNIGQVIRKIYDDINELINEVNNEFGNLNTQKGKTGNIRIKKTDTNSYNLEAKTSDGWASIPLALKDTEG